jgi:hypothetical protein
MTAPLTRWRVWPDGTAQDIEEGPPYPWMSDDFCEVSAATEEEAVYLALEYPHP